MQESLTEPFIPLTRQQQKRYPAYFNNSLYRIKLTVTFVEKPQLQIINF